MPIISYQDMTPEGKKRRELIDQLFPTEPIVDSFLQPRLLEATEDILLKALKKEIEIYKAYPKKGNYVPSAFDPRNNLTCFMGQGFQYNGTGLEGWYDGELAEYRKKIGTIAHKEWGACTLLEIWGADHFKDYPEMVTKVMKYCWGERKTLPNLQFFINPFFKNSQSGKAIIADIQKEQDLVAEHMAKLGAYIEIRDRLKRAGIDLVTDLAINEADDPVPKQRRRSGINKFGEEDDDE